ncbi:MAG: glucose-6-phosphate isomerase, partial [Actinobacteria bacterium]|nr:glucose-6-phosphate isomerase [Actinomycetota bacterium]
MKISLNDSTKRFIEDRIFSRIAAQDVSLFEFDTDVKAYAGDYFGWTNLATKPPINPVEIATFAKKVRDEGLKSVVLIGQGGSTQAAMTITKLNAVDNTEIAFKTMDSISPVYVEKILNECEPSTTLYIVSSKSGSTTEPTLLSRIAWDYAYTALGQDAAANRFVAITDPDSLLESVAEKNKWRAIFSGPTDVGGRFSALSAFGLLPAALVGIDIVAFLEEAAITERLCSLDSLENPALWLATFLYDNYLAGRPKFSLVSPQPGRVFGLWVEQLVAESLGKCGHGILPNIEIDASMLARPHDDRCAITYAIRPDASFESDIDRIDPSIPTLHCSIPNVMQLARHFLMWEYAVCAVAVLMEINPFDQPDVALTKEIVKNLLTAEANIGSTAGCHRIPIEKNFVIEAELSPAVCTDTPSNLDEALEVFFSSLQNEDYFSLNAFLPFTKEVRRIPLEEIRHCVA